MNRNALPRSLLTATVVRTAWFAAGLLVLVVVFQLLRASELLPGGRLPLPLAARLLWGALPSLLALLVPMALLIAAPLTLAEAVVDGELEGWMSLGRRRRTLVSGPLLVGGLLALVVAAIFGWLGPLALQSAGDALQQAWRGLALQRVDETVATPVGADQVVLGRALPRAETLGAERVRWLIDGPLGAELAADILSVSPPSPGGGNATAELRGVRYTERARGAARNDCLTLAADQVVLPIPWASSSAATAIIPQVERWTVPQLLERADTGDPMATGQLFKRAALVLLPPGVLTVLLLAALTVRGFARPGRVALVALSGAAGVHATARWAELAGRVGPMWGCAVLLAALAVVLAVTGWCLARAR